MGPGLPIIVATTALFAVSPLVAPGSLQLSSLASMLPFAAILAIAAIGQTLVIQQGGLDFSVAGTVTLSVVLLTKVADRTSGNLCLAVGAALAATIFVGVCNGLLVTRLQLSSLIATLAMNSLLLGGVQQITGGLSVVPAPDALTRFALGTTFGCFNTVVLAVAVLLIYWVVIKSTVFGRRFEAAGAGAAAARIAGIPIDAYRVFAYAAAAATYAIAGIMLAGFLRTPGLDIGDAYLLATIAAVVVGGTALTGGTGSALTTAIGAVFLSQLNALLLATGAATAINFLLQGVAIGLTMGVREWAANRRRQRDRRSRSATLRTDAAIS